MHSTLHWWVLGTFLVIFLIILLENGVIILITRVETTLRTVIFLSSKSAMIVTLPRMLKRTISFLSCATQMGFFLVLGAAECFLLAGMAYDCYVAICSSLQYPLIMNHKVCIQLVTGSRIVGFLVQVGQTLARGNTFFVNEVVVCTLAVLFVTVPFMLSLASYSRIISTILRLPSNTGRARAFSLCPSHLRAVFLFYRSTSITYFHSKSYQCEGIENCFLSSYLFDPMVYSLWNKDVTGTLRKFHPKLL
uniref:G-protein coupled receptors family 1 profile domain-containing protein n=1 Tax=Chinchilla lanigera TaxID=34839 RepID=A0A8C2V0T5_CHILA